MKKRVWVAVIVALVILIAAIIANYDVLLGPRSAKSAKTTSVSLNGLTKGPPASDFFINARFSEKQGAGLDSLTNDNKVGDSLIINQFTGREVDK